MGGGYQLDAPLCDSPGGGGLFLGAHLVDDDDLGHVVLNGLDHHRVLAGRGGHLHAPGSADCGMRHVPIAGNLIGGVNDYHPLPRTFGV